MQCTTLFGPDPPSFSSRVIEMMDTFSNSYNYGDETDSCINTASVPDICHLLRYFLESLPAPPLEHVIFRPLTDLCVIPSTLERREREKHGEVGSQEDILAGEEYRIVLAKLILRLLPKAHFGSLAYIVAFLAQLPHSSAADLTIDKLSVMFGPMVCAPRDPLAYLEAEQTFPDDEDFKMDMHVLEDASKKYITGLSEDTLHWLLTHWDHLAEGLFEEDHIKDITNFQEMVAHTVWFDQAEGDKILPSQGSVTFINPFGTPQGCSKQKVPNIPPRLYDDDTNDLLEEESDDGAAEVDERDMEGDLASQQASHIAQLEADIAAARRQSAVSEHNAAWASREASLLREQLGRLTYQ